MGGGPYCEVTAACVHQDVELPEKRERKMLGQEAWTHSLRFSVLYPRPAPATWSPFGVSRVKLPDAGLDRLAPVSTRTTDTGWRPVTASSRPQKPCVCFCLLCRTGTFSVSSEPHHWRVRVPIPVSAIRCPSSPWVLAQPVCRAHPFPSSLVLGGTSSAGSLAHPPSRLRDQLFSELALARGAVGTRVAQGDHMFLTLPARMELLTKGSPLSQR